MADLLSTLLGKSGSTTTVTTSPEAIAALNKALNINLDAATSPAAAEAIVKKALESANSSVTTGAAATRGSGAYSSAALQVAREKALAEAANNAQIQIAQSQQQSAAQATQAAQALANATRVTSTGTANDPTSQMLEIMRSVGASTLASSPATSTKTSTASGTTAGTGSQLSFGEQLGSKALSYGGKIAQAGVTSAVLKGLAGSVNPLVGAFLGLAASDVIKTGTSSLTDSIAEFFGLKKKAEETQPAAAAVDAGMVDFVNAAASAGYDMSPSGTTIEASGFDESTQALADLMGLTNIEASQQLGDLGGNDSDWSDFLGGAATEFKGADQLGYEADRGSLSDTFGGGENNDDYSDTRGSLF